MKRCLGCMNEYKDEYTICPNCGYMVGAEPEESIHMLPGTILLNRYIIGKVLGFGGFGVTYLAWDTVLLCKVAIKEYLPSEFSTRMPGEKIVSIFDGEKHEQFISGMESFVCEAKKLAKFNDIIGIVKIYDSFLENDTAYIVMEYLDGITLEKFLEKEKCIQPEKAITMLMPIMEALKKVHKDGIIHRDLSPDNIMVCDDGQLKLIDFGAARYATTSHSRSLTVIIKPGYSPEEQYRSRGDQGPHTDVYAIGAILYKMITGIRPPDAIMRRATYESKKKDILEKIKKYNKDIPQNIENAILNAMNIRIEDRSANIDILIDELTTDKIVKHKNGKIKKIDIYKWPLWAKIFVPLGGITVVVLGILFALGIIGFKSDLQKEILIPDGMTRVPSVINTYLDNSEEALEKAKLMYTFEDKQESDVIPKDYVLWQSENPGKITTINSEISIIVSSGPVLVKVESVVGFSKEEAVNRLEQLGFVVSFREEYDNTSVVGSVLEQSIAGEEYVQKGSQIELVISKGKENDIQDIKYVDIPDFVGMTYSDVVKKAEELGIIITVKSREYSSTVPINTVMQQNIPAGTKMINTDVLELVVSNGEKLIRVEDITLKSSEEAIRILEDLGFVVEIKEYRYDSNVKNGSVISQSISAGSMKSPGTVIEIIVSLGRQGFVMPDVVKMKENEAYSLLVEKGLSVSISYATSDNISAGYVISQSISKNTQVISGTTVNLIVSSGEELIEVPDLVDKYYESTAISKLESLNFNVQIVREYNNSISAGKVCAQSLGAGTLHKKDTNIIITISKGKQPIIVTFNANGGSCSVASKSLYVGDSYGTLPVPSRDYYTFSGWYTSASGGSKITSSSSIGNTNITLFARWTLNSTSSWVLASNVPSGAQIVNTKWTYTLTETIKSWSDSESGYTLIGSEWYLMETETITWANFPSGFDTTNSIYTNMEKSEPVALEGPNAKTEVSTTWAGYVYWHWMYPLAEECSAGNRWIYNKKGYCSFNGWTYNVFGAFKSTTNYSTTVINDTCGQTVWKATDRTSFADTQGSYWYYRFNYYTSVRKGYMKYYTHQKITNNIESTKEVVAGNGISNVKKYVQYREK